MASRDGNRLLYLKKLALCSGKVTKNYDFFVFPFDIIILFLSFRVPSIIDTPIYSYTYNGNAINYNLRIIQEYFLRKIGRKIRIFSLGRENSFLMKNECNCFFFLFNFSGSRLNLIDRYSLNGDTTCR